MSEDYQEVLPGFEGFVDQPMNEEEGAIVPVVDPVSVMAQFGYHDLDQLDSDEVIIPKLRLAQGLTAEVTTGDAKSGQWILTGYPALDEVTVTPMKMQRRRTLYSQEEERVVCRSNDGKTGEGNPGGLCEHCPNSQWTKVGDRSVGPTCTFIFSYLVYIHEFQTYAVLEFKKTSEKVGKQLNTWILMRGFGNFSVRLSSQNMKKPGRSWEVPVLRLVE